MAAVYRYRDGRGKVVQAPVRGQPRITVRQRAGVWHWRLEIKTLSPTGDKERHHLDGEAATEPQAVSAARALLGEIVKEQKASRAKLVKATTYAHGGATIETKRDCTSGRFVPASSVVNNCVLPPPKKHVPWWLDKRPVKKESICYPTRAEALRAFVDANQAAINRAGGMDQVTSDGSWDPINSRYGLKGKRRVFTVRQGIEAVMPHGRPFCLDRMDLETLNETRPAEAAGGFLAPDFVEQKKWQKRMEREYAEMGTNPYEEG